MINVALGKAQTHYGTELGITCEFQQYLLVLCILFIFVVKQTLPLL